MAHNPLRDFQKQTLELQKHQADLMQKRVGLEAQSVDLSPEKGLVQNLHGLASQRQPGWKMLLDGVMSGVHYGLSAQERKKKEALYQKMGQWFESMEANAREAQKMNEEGMRKEQMKQEVLIPAAMTYQTFKMGNLETGQRPSFQETSAAAKEQFDKLKASGVLQGEFSGVDYNNDDIILFRDPQGKVQHFDVSTLIPLENKRAMPSLTAAGRMKTRMDQEDHHQERALKQGHYDLAREKLDLDRQKLNQKQSQGQHHDLAHLQQEYRIYDDAEKLLQGEEDPTYTAGLDWTPENWKSPETAQFEQLAADARGTTFKRFGYRNETEFKHIKTLDPKLSREANLAIIRSKKKELEGLMERGGGEHPSVTPPPTQPPVQQQALPEQGAENAVPQEDRVLMMDPETGEEQPVPSWQVDEALGMGLVKK